jgi:hypothetical protein
MPEAEKVAEKIDLAIRVRSPSVLVHLLEEHEVGLVSGDDLSHSERIVLAIDTPDALVDVVGDDSKAHEDDSIRSKRTMITRWTATLTERARAALHPALSL